VDRDVLDIGGKGRVVFAFRSFLPQLVLYMKQSDSFFEIEVDVMDDKRVVKTISISNHRSLIKVRPRLERS
jgi:hypothetical protein